MGIGGEEDEDTNENGGEDGNKYEKWDVERMRIGIEMEMIIKIELRMELQMEVRREMRIWM